MADKTSKGKKKLFPKLAKDEVKAPDTAPEAEKETSTGSDGNVFTNLFDEEKGKEKNDNDVADSVIKKSETKGSILGPKPKTDNLNIAERPSSFGGSLLKLVVFLWLLLLVGSYITTTASFDVAGLNQTLASESSLEELMGAQAEFNANNYLIAYYYLDSFAYMADSYIYKTSQYESAYTSSNTKDSLEAEINELESDMSIALSLAQERLSKDVSPSGVEIESDLSVDILFKEATQEYLEDKIADLEDGDAADDADIQLEISGLNGALALIKNGAFVKEVVSADLESTEEIVDGLSDITEDNFTVISKIKSDRQKWSEIIQEIQTITKEVDPLYGTSIASDISYSSYGFDTSAKTVSLQGTAITDDTRNFTLIVNLIDALEQSSLFINVDERSFTKSDASDDNNEYEARFRLEFEIQEGTDSRDATFVLEESEVMPSETIPSNSEESEAEGEESEEPAVKDEDEVEDEEEATETDES